MTVLEDNHLALDQPLRAAVEGLLPGVFVGGFVEYMEFLDSGGDTPSVYVYYSGDSVDGRGPHQAMVKQTWEIVIASTPERVQGLADLAPHGALLATVIRGLSGLRLPGVQALARQPDPDAPRYGGGVLLSVLAFSATFEVR